MSMQIREGQRAPYNPEIWDQYDTHPGHPEPVVAEAHAGHLATSVILEDIVFESYSGSATNQLPSNKQVRLVA